MSASAPIVLASSSPRRREILERLGLRFEVSRPDADERRRPGEPPADYVLRSAREKARSVAETLTGREPRPWVIGADTAVVIDGSPLGKPVDRDDARAMLEAASGRAHDVLTGWTVLRAGSDAEASGVEITRVWFRALGASEIEGYVASGEGDDKAGAYGIQGLGCFLVERIEGNYENVVGLPASPLVEALLSLGATARFPDVPIPSEEVTR